MRWLRWTLRGLEFKVELAAGGGGRARRVLARHTATAGAVLEEHKSVGADERARSTSTYAAARPRDPSTRFASSGAAMGRGLKFYVKLAAGGGWRVRRSLMRRASAVDAARGEHKSIGAAEGSALD